MENEERKNEDFNKEFRNETNRKKDGNIDRADKILRNETR